MKPAEITDGAGPIETKSDASLLSLTAVDGSGMFSGSNARGKEVPFSPMSRFSSLALIGTLVLSLASVACTFTRETKDTRATDEATIRSYSQAASDAARDKNVDKLVSFYADDAIGYNSDGPTLTTPEAIRADAQQGLSVPGSTLTWKTAAVVVARSGDLAYERGRYAYTYVASQKDGGGTRTQTGNYVLVWQKRPGGTWKIVSDMDTADPQPSKQ